MKVIFRKNQVIISALAVMLAVAGYLTYATDEDAWSNTSVAQGNNSNTVFEISDEDILTNNQNVSSTGESNGNDSNISDSEVANNSDNSNSELVDIASLDQDASDIVASDKEELGDAVLTSGMTIADYMAQSKLDREQMRGMTKEALLEIINNDTLTSEEKQSAIDRLVSINSVVEKENATETLLKSKGFSEVIVSIQDNQVDVVVGKESLTDAEVAQIEDIVKRKTEMGVESIVISLVNMEKE